MTDHDIQLLALGFMLGGYVVLLLQLLGDAWDDRRDRQALQRATTGKGTQFASTPDQQIVRTRSGGGSCVVSTPDGDQRDAA